MTVVDDDDEDAVTTCSRCAPPPCGTTTPNMPPQPRATLADVSTSADRHTDSFHPYKEQATTHCQWRGEVECQNRKHVSESPWRARYYGRQVLGLDHAVHAGRKEVGLPECCSMNDEDGGHRKPGTRK
jgi:hypothetical protein